MKRAVPETKPSGERRGVQLARALGWFSVGLGLAQIAAPRAVARLIGVRPHRKHAGWLRALGVRELASGVGLLTRRKAEDWMWTRVAGDALDLTLLGAAFKSRGAQPGRLAAATAAAAGVAALDLWCCRQLNQSASASAGSLPEQREVAGNKGEMSLPGKVASLVTGGKPSPPPVPQGAIYVADFSPLNWLYITYNTVEEAVRVNTNGVNQPAAMKTYRWVDDTTLEIEVREGNRFPDGELLTAHSVKRSFDEQQRWQSPHPPGTHFNVSPLTHCEVMGDYRVRFHYPEPDGLAVGKLRATHIMNTRFWDEIGFGYQRQHSGEGHW